MGEGIYDPPHGCDYRGVASTLLSGEVHVFCDCSLHFRTLHASCKHILGPGYPQSKRVDSVSRDLNNNGCGIFSLSDTSHLVVLDESDSSANGPRLYHCVVVCQSVDSLHLRCI